MLGKALKNFKKESIIDAKNVESFEQKNSIKNNELKIGCSNFFDNLLSSNKDYTSLCLNEQSLRLSNIIGRDNCEEKINDLNSSNEEKMIKNSNNNCLVESLENLIHVSPNLNNRNIENGLYLKKNQKL